MGYLTAIELTCIALNCPKDIKHLPHNMTLGSIALAESFPNLEDTQSCECDERPFC